VVGESRGSRKACALREAYQLNVAEAKGLLAVRDRTGVKIGEAFMVKTHPQWLRTQEIIRSGGIGDLRAIAECSVISTAILTMCGTK